MQIGAGNLDTPVRVNSTDEIGELCRDFEEMRIRLKEMIEDRIRYEQDTRDMMSNMAHDSARHRSLPSKDTVRESLMALQIHRKNRKNIFGPLFPKQTI